MKPPESLLIGWTDFQKNVTETFQNVRLSTDFSDVTLVLDGDNGLVEAHRVVLAAGSTFFHRVLSEIPRSHPHPLIYLAGVSHPHSDNILDFLYNGQTKLPHIELPGFLETAKSLGIKGLAEDPEDFTETCIEETSNKARETTTKLAAEETGDATGQVIEAEESVKLELIEGVSAATPSLVEKIPHTGDTNSLDRCG